MVKVKICGITNAEDALAAARYGADALGFVFAESPRKIDKDTARSICLFLPPFVSRVGVFVDEDVGRMLEICDYCGLNYAQLHGEEPPGKCNTMSGRAIKAVRVRGEESLDGLENYSVLAFLLDAYSPERLGGTGKTFSWDIAVMAKALGKPVILSGGLTPVNVAGAISTVKPYAVDVSSGVERAPGKKDHDLVKEFIRAAKGVDPYL